MLQRAHLHALSIILVVAAVISDIQPGYLDFDNLPETNFSCEGKVIGGYYADVETGCQMFHVCTIGQKGEVSDIKFLCLNGTVFDQETRVCERIDEVDCDKSEDFFNLNLELYGNTASFGTHDCTDEDCDDGEEEEEENDDVEYDDDIESTTILTTTSTTVRTTTTKRPTTVRTTLATSPRTRYTTPAPDHISALLALHNAFNQGLNRRPILNPVSTTRLPSPPTTTRRPTIPLTIRTRYGNDNRQQPDNGYILRSTLRPTYQPSFTSSLQTPLKSNYHTFESSDAHFAHSFDPEKPYHFQYFSHKSSPSPFTVRVEPQVSVVTSTSTSTSIKIANTTVDEFPYDDYDDVDTYFHDIPKITRPKRSTTLRSLSRSIKNNQQNRLFGTNTPSGFVKNTPSSTQIPFIPSVQVTTNYPVLTNNQPSGFIKTEVKNSLNNTDHVIKIDPSDVLLSKNYTGESSEPKTEYLNNLLDTIAMEDNEKKQVLNLLRNSEPEMEQLLSNKGVDMMLEKLENKLLEMELEGRGTGVAFEYEGDSLEIREKRGSDNKSYIGIASGKKDINEEDDIDDISCKNPEFCTNNNIDDEVIQLKIENRRKRAAITRPRTPRIKIDDYSNNNNDDNENYPNYKQHTTSSPQIKTTKKSRRKNQRPNQPRTSNNRNQQNRQNNGERSKQVWDLRKQNNQRERVKTTKKPEVKPVTEEIENDITTVEYRRPPIKLNGKSNRHSFSDNTTPYSIPSSTRLQTRFEYKNQNNSIISKKVYSTERPSHYRHAPVHENYEIEPELIEINKQKKSSRIKRSPLTFRYDNVGSSQQINNDEHKNIKRMNVRNDEEIEQSTKTVDYSPYSYDLYGMKQTSNIRIDSSPEHQTARNTQISRTRSRQRISNSESIEENKPTVKPVTHVGRTRSRTRITERITPQRTEFNSERPRINEDLEKNYRSRNVNQDHSPLNAEKIEYETGSILKSKMRTSNRHNIHPVNYHLESVNNDRISPSSRSNSRDTLTPNVTPRRTSEVNVEQINRRRKVVRNRVTYSDRSVLPEEITYATLRPEIISNYDSNEKRTDRKEIEVITTESPTTFPPTPYTPRPGIDADPNFSCRGKVKGGLYADVFADCHGFFICSQAKRGIVATHFWCGVGTRFSQKSRTCQAESLVDCSLSPRLYHLNDNQYTPSIDLEDKLRGGFEPMRVQ